MGRFLQGGSSADASVPFSSTLVLLPIPDTLRSWQADHESLATALDAVLPVGHPSRLGAAAQAGDMSVQTVGELAAPAVPDLGREVRQPHCLVPGVLCNMAGRVTHVDATAALQAAAVPMMAAPATTALEAVFNLPWLVAGSVQGLNLDGPLPSLSSALQPPDLVRSSSALPAGVGFPMASARWCASALALVARIRVLIAGVVCRCA